MSAQTSAILDERRGFARPGGSHDRLIGILNKALPAAIGVVAAIMVLVPLSPRGEVSFLLDRRKVAITGERIDVDKAMYRGTDNEGRQFEVTAGQAVQASPDQPTIAMRDLAAQLQLEDGDARVTAPAGSYDYHTEQVTSDQPLTFTAADGYRMTMKNVDIDLKSRTASGAGGVAGSVPTGSFSADRIDADLARRTVALVGNARLRMVPGQLRMPQ